MRIISCKKCGAKVSDQYSYCTKCQAPINADARKLEAEYPDIEPTQRTTLVGWLLSPVEAKRKPKLKLPSDTRQGALIGAFIGLISGILAATYVYLLDLPFVWNIETTRFVGSPRILAALPTLWTILVALIVIGVPIMEVIMGTLLGVLFVVVRKRLPGSTIIRKSVAFSFILLAIEFLIGVLGRFGSSMAVSLDKATSATAYWLQVANYVILLVEFPLLGWLFGYLLNRKLGQKRGR